MVNPPLTRKGSLIGSSPVPSRTMKTTPTLTPEYTEAVQLLSEQRLNQACGWLLDDSEDTADANTEKLLDLYDKASQACQVLKKQHAPPPPPPPPNMSVARSTTNRSLGKLPSSAVVLRQSKAIRGGRKRGRSDSDAGRAPPPPAALNFLAKLNKDRDAKKKSTG